MGYEPTSIKIKAMSKNLHKELIDRLICSKYLFHRGVDILNRRGPFSSGLAVLHFQDAAEMVLRVIAEYFNCSLKENAAFNQIIDTIDNIGNTKITHRIALNQLNKARINFKHFGLEPKYEDANKFRYDLEGFFPTALRSFLDIDFGSISLTSLIGHRRTENFLNEAERLISEEKYRESISASAVAFTIFHSHYNKEPGIYRRDPFRRFNVKDEELQRWADNIDEVIEEQQSQLDLIMLGINLADYRRFKRYTPIVHLSMAGTFQIVHGGFGKPIEPTKETALFCHQFVIDAILIMKANQLPPQFPIRESKRKFRVAKKCPIIVWPCENPEIIRYAEEGEILSGRAKNYDKSEYVAIFQDGDEAYIEKNFVVSDD